MHDNKKKCSTEINEQKINIVKLHTYHIYLISSSMNAVPYLC